MFKMQLRELHFYPSMPYDNVLDTNSIDRAKMEFGGHSGFSVIVDGRKLPTFLVLPLPFLLVFWGCAIYKCVVLLRDTLISTVSNPWAQTLISQSISSSPIFRHFYQVIFSRQNIMNRMGWGWSRYQVQWSAKHSYADENLEEVVVVVAFILADTGNFYE